MENLIKTSTYEYVKNKEWPFSAVFRTVTLGKSDTETPETILASNHTRLHPKAAHMEANDLIKFFRPNLLQKGAVHI